MPDGQRSPYGVVFGDTLNELHPRLREYFGAIPSGWHGWGAGRFDRVGTPRRWLWPALWLLQRQGILFAGWHENVDFTVLNTPGVSATGRPCVRAVRRFEFARGGREMVDSIEAVDAERPRLVDYLGRSRLIEAVLHATVVDGALRMRSTTIVLKIAGVRLPVPAAVSPRVTLVERFDERSNLQHVGVEVSAPLLGRLYEYAGSFHYEIRPGDGKQ